MLILIEEQKERPIDKMDISKLYAVDNIDVIIFVSLMILVSLLCIIFTRSWHCFPDANWALVVQMVELAKPTLPPAEFEPMIAVTMAGDKVPTYLAKQVSAIQSGQQEV
ncbi:hypothetical protein ACHQM5_008750 [Ranunculus cassubicifolius]